MSTLPETTKISESQLRWQYLGGKRTFLIVAGCFLVGLLLFRIGFSFWYGARQARQAKVTVAAQVMDKGQSSELYKKTRAEPQVTYWLHYRFRDSNGHSQDGRVTLSPREWEKFEKYDDIMIDYPREHPEESGLAAVPTFTGQWVMHMGLSLGGILFVGSSLCGVGGWMWATRKARCLLRGTPVLGEVTDRVSPFWAQVVSPARHQLRFQYVDGQGNMRNGRSHWLPEDIACCWNAGNSILVLCDPEFPTRGEADVFQIRDADKERLLSENSLTT